MVGYLYIERLPFGPHYLWYTNAPESYINLEQGILEAGSDMVCLTPPDSQGLFKQSIEAYSMKPQAQCSTFILLQYCRQQLRHFRSVYSHDCHPSFIAVGRVKHVSRLSKRRTCHRATEGSTLDYGKLWDSEQQVQVHINAGKGITVQRMVFLSVTSALHGDDIKGHLRICNEKSRGCLNQARDFYMCLGWGWYVPSYAADWTDYRARGVPKIRETHHTRRRDHLERPPPGTENVWPFT